LPQESYQYKWPLSHFLEKFGVQSVLATHWPEAMQDSLAKQEPQFTAPPQLSFQTPHNLLSDEHVAGTHEETHWPEALQVCPEAQVPQKSQPPHWSETMPHCFPCAEQLLQVPEHREAVSSRSPGALNGKAAAQ
jgi:hypothetical protein